MSFLSPVFGSLTVELTSADPETALQIICSTDISISNVHRKTDLTYLFSISPRSYSHVANLCKKHGDSVKVTSKHGLYWLIIRSFKRKTLLFGFLLFLLFSILLPTRVLFVSVQGNQRIPTNRILSAAQECGISFGASRRQVRSEKVKNNLLSALPQLQWVGVNTAGCVATISVREREETEPVADPQISSIIADRDGYLLTVTVSSGNPLCQPGQYVTEGQLLVSGYTDCGIYIQATPSTAEIFAQTSRDFEAVRLSKYIHRIKEVNINRNYSLLIGKKRINLWKDSGIPDSSCGRIYKEKYATLPGGFQLPVALCIDEYTSYDTAVISTGNTGAEDALSSFADAYLHSHMMVGSILSRAEQFTYDKDLIRLTGEYTCQEMIGRVQQIQIGD